MEVLKDFTDLKVYMHCRGYGPDEVLECVKTFPQLRIGYTGVVTYPKAQSIRESLMITPSESILTETDAPYLAPQPVRSKTNEPAFLKHTIDFLEGETGLEPEIFEENARKLYGI
jgi:TatD DNase family protein